MMLGIHSYGTRQEGVMRSDGVELSGFQWKPCDIVVGHFITLCHYLYALLLAVWAARYTDWCQIANTSGLVICKVYLM